MHRHPQGQLRARCRFPPLLPGAALTSRLRLAKTGSIPLFSKLHKNLRVPIPADQGQGRGPASEACRGVGKQRGVFPLKPTRASSISSTA
jgi:hypothetical protein